MPALTSSWGVRARIVGGGRARDVMQELYRIVRSPPIGPVNIWPSGHLAKSLEALTQLAQLLVLRRGEFTGSFQTARRKPNHFGVGVGASALVQYETDREDRGPVRIAVPAGR
jgi:hypothetical protein